MKIFVVEHGRYDDAEVVAVTDDETKANAVAKLDHDGTVRSFVVDEFVDLLLAGYRKYCVTYLDQPVNCLLDVGLDLSPTQLTERKLDRTSFRNEPSYSRPVVEIYVNARTKAEAIELVTTERDKYVSTWAAQK